MYVALQKGLSNTFPMHLTPGPIKRNFMPGAVHQNTSSQLTQEVCLGMVDEGACLHLFT